MLTVAVTGPTGEIGKLSQPGGPLYNIEHSNGGLITVPGGLPIKDDDGSVAFYDDDYRRIGEAMVLWYQKKSARMLTPKAVLRVAELAAADRAVYRYVRRVFSPKFSPIDSANVWTQILPEVRHRTSRT